MIIPADLVTSRQMLTGIKERVARQKVRDQVATLASAIRHGDRAIAVSLDGLVPVLAIQIGLGRGSTSGVGGRFAAAAHAEFGEQI